MYRFSPFFSTILISRNEEQFLPKNCWNYTKLDFTQFSTVFVRFLGPGTLDLCLVFCIMTSILRHKFRVPTKGTLGVFFRLIEGSGQKLWLIAGDQDGWEKSWKFVHGFIIAFLSIYFWAKLFGNFLSKCEFWRFYTFLGIDLGF